MQTIKYSNLICLFQIQDKFIIKLFVINNNINKQYKIEYIELSSMKNIAHNMLLIIFTRATFVRDVFVMLDNMFYWKNSYAKNENRLYFIHVWTRQEDAQRSGFRTRKRRVEKSKNLCSGNEIGGIHLAVKY